MKRDDKTVSWLIGLTLVLFIYLFFFGERVNSANTLELIALVPFVISPVIIFLWMGFHCILNQNIQRKWIWILVLLFTTYFGAVIHYLVVYRKPSINIK